jgi:hypothetical protein
LKLFKECIFPLTWSFGAGSDDFWVLKLDKDGTVAWQKTYGGTGNDSAYSIQQTSDGGYIVAGETDSSGAGNADAWGLKLDSNGNITGCSAEGSSNATVMTTNVSGVDSSAIPADTSVNAVTSNATITNTTVSGAVLTCVQKSVSSGKRAGGYGKG